MLIELNLKECNMGTINKTDGLLTEFYLAASGTALTTASEVATAISSAKQIKNISTFGDVSLGDYAVNTLSVFGGNFVKSLGSKTAGNLAVTIVFDALDATGQADIIDMHTNKTYRELIVKYDDTPSSGSTKNPTYVCMTIGIASASLPTTLDSVITLNVTMEIMELPKLIKAAFTA